MQTNLSTRVAHSKLNEDRCSQKMRNNNEDRCSQKMTNLCIAMPGFRQQAVSIVGLFNYGSNIPQFNYEYITFLRTSVFRIFNGCDEVTVIKP